MSGDIVSIIIPTYNRKDYLFRAINSVLNQTYQKFELIIIDDHSYDGTQETVIQIKDERIHYYRNDVNRGAPFSRNFGLKKSIGKFINFLDDDDLLLPAKIEKQLQKFEFRQNIQDLPLGVVTCDAKYIYGKNQIEIKPNRKKGNLYRELLHHYCVYGTGSLLIKREALSKIKFDENLKAGQEFDLLKRISKKYSFDYVPEILFLKIASKNQISTSFQKRIKTNIYFLKKYFKSYRNQGIPFLIKGILIHLGLISKYTLGSILGNKIYNYLFYILHRRIPKSLISSLPNVFLV